MKESHRPVVVMFVTALTWLELGAAPGATVQAPEWVRFELIPDLAVPIVPARLNGSQGYPFLLDPTISDVLLDNTLIAGSGMELPNRGEVQEIDYFGDKEQVPVVYLATLEIGPIGAQGVKGLIIEGDDLARSQGIASYGRIGRDFLEPFRLTIHYPRRLLLLEPSPEGADVPAGGVFFDKALRGVHVETVVNQKLSTTFIVDPSVAICLLDRDWALDQKLADGDAKGIVLESFAVGGFRTSRVPVQLVEMEKLPYPGRPLGVLGSSLLRELSVTYDFSRGLIWLRTLEGG
ncbi:MAG: hypothetical protein ACRD1X_16150 [Vicinamibacteria bacterium]